MAVGEARDGVPRAPNSVLRSVREERGETRAEFAEAMARVARETGETVYPDWKYVERLESGEIAWPGRVYRSILEKLCGRPAWQLGFSPRSHSGSSSGRASGEAVDHVNEALRDAIWADGMEITEFARKVGVDPKTAERWITGGRTPHPRHRWKASQILGHAESELWPGLALAEEDVQDRRKFEVGTTRANAEEDDEEMERRRLLQSLAALGINISPLNQALETVRRSFGAAVGYDEREHLDFWEENIVEYGYSYRVTSPVNLVPDLAADLITVRSIMRRIRQDSSEYRSWCRVGGALSALMAKSLSNLGQSRNSRDWWNMAQHLSDASGDINLALLVRGEHIIHGLYENRAVPVLLRQVKSAEEFTGNHPCVGLIDLSGAQAQVSVLAGDYSSAEKTLRRTEDILGRVSPPDAARGMGLVMDWGEAELRYTETWVYSYMGEVVKTDRAAEHALSLYPASDMRSPTQIKLMQAFTRIQRGDVTEGIRQAQAAYGPMAFGRTAMVDALARRVLSAVPPEAQERSDVAEYRTLVVSRTPEGRMIEA